MTLQRTNQLLHHCPKQKLKNTPGFGAGEGLGNTDRLINTKSIFCLDLYDTSNFPCWSKQEKQQVLPAHRQDLTEWEPGRSQLGHSCTQ